MMRLRSVVAKATLIFVPVACSANNADCDPSRAIETAQTKAETLSWDTKGWSVNARRSKGHWVVTFSDPEAGTGGRYDFAINEKTCTVAEHRGYQ